jgi:hypothetical protein
MNIDRTVVTGKLNGSWALVELPADAFAVHVAIDGLSTNNPAAVEAVRSGNVPTVFASGRMLAPKVEICSGNVYVRAARGFRDFYVRTGAALDELIVWLDTYFQGWRDRHVHSGFRLVEITAFTQERINAMTLSEQVWATLEGHLSRDV